MRQGTSSAAGRSLLEPPSTPWTRAPKNRAATRPSGGSRRTAPTAFPRRPRTSPLVRLARHFNNLLILVLIAAAAITAVLGRWSERFPD